MVDERPCAAKKRVEVWDDVLMATALKSKIRNTSSCLQADSVSLSIAGALLHDLFNFLSSPVPFRMQG